MNAVLFSLLKKLASSDNSDNNNQVIITHGKLIRGIGQIDGLRPGLKETKRALAQGVDEGLIRIDPLPPGHKLLNPFNRQLLISFTERGRAHTIPDKPKPLRPRLDSQAKYLGIKAQAVIEVLKKLCEHYGKLYCFPSQSTIIKYCHEWEGVKISIRTLNRILPQLEGKGWLSMACRHKQNADGTWMFRSTLYTLSGKVFEMCKKAVARASKFFHSFGLPEMANNLFIRKRIIQGGTVLEGASPPCLDDKGGPSARYSSKEQRQANILNLKRLQASLT